MTFSGTWEAEPGQFFDDGAHLIEGAEDPHANATDAELAAEMRNCGNLAKVIRDWDLEGLIEVYVGQERVW